MNRPTTIFKYEPLTVCSLGNLKTNSIYFGSPLNFNDPYDCAITAETKPLTENDLEIIRKHYLDDEEIPRDAKTELEKASPEEMAIILTNAVSGMIERQRDDFLENKGVSCFSEENNNLLMWSHYANRCQGFCLEFDSSRDPFSKMRKVKYSKSMPKLDPLPVILSNDASELLDLFCTKSHHWAYEREWRSIHNEAGTLYNYESETLKGVYFGPDMDEAYVEIICTILFCQNPNVKLYKGKRSANQFEVLFDEFNYIPHVLAEQIRNKKGA